ncbi:threonine/serine exporter family protein [Chloroflexia bacterium SDU3-3]|nr:threonine/serine exporter family protein [Chloroflexia bacterium SDU3-3]
MSYDLLLERLLLQHAKVESSGSAAKAATREEMREILAAAMRAGQIMLENGANTARAEETVHYVALALGADSCDVYVTPTGIIATIYAGTEHRTRIQRIVRSNVDLSKVAAVGVVSRRASRRELDRAGVQAALEQAAGQPREYTPLITTLAVGLACACSAILFGGGVWEAAIAFVSAALAYYVRGRLMSLQLSRPLLTFFVATIAASLALALVALLRPPHPAQALTAAVLFLVPGVPMISSVVDLFRGDTVSGTARAVSALLMLIGIAGGLWATLLVSGAKLDLTPGVSSNIPLAMAMAFCSAGGFGVMFDVPRRALAVAALVGALVYGLYRVFQMWGVPIGAAAFLAGMSISLLSELLSRRMLLPTPAFTIPGFLPLVPGSAAFRTLLNFVAEDYAAGSANLVRTAIIVIALAAGIGTVSALARLGQRQP